ncbi:hypothetical protein [Hymenobacter elongatus]|uniref:Uncharacterized protein n=1 Tax=Hymenobacter elongatus TaxID=877208 RepID=A0A4Z0PPZ7_9BACT|nr:hypothetical protein [Hymenobacter elongatus]TGE18945.1 hypothetical protein E5J99_04170 [Hymenobacter elongatus]
MCASTHERACEEQQGHIRYLRPAYQAPETVQATMVLPEAAKGTKLPSFLQGGVAEGRGGQSLSKSLNEATQPFPTELAQQMHTLRDTLQQAAQPLTAAQVAARFKRLEPEKVEPLLATLAALSLIRHPEEGYTV